MIMTDKGMDALLSTSVKLGGDISVAAGPYGAGAKAATVDVLAFAKAKGVFGGISVEGSVITPRDSYNIAYYQRNVRPVDIIIRRSVSNPHSKALIEAVSRPCRQKPVQQPAAASE
jgi:lipid-binding SYLF domain-containing protein